MWKWYTAQDRREAGGLIILIALLLLLVAALLLLVLAGTMSGVPASRWLPAGISFLGGGKAAAAAFPGLVAWQFWCAGAGLGLLSAWGLWFATRFLWRTFQPTGQGFATRADVAGELSETQARKKAAVVRGDLDRKERGRASISELALPLGKTPWQEPLWLPLENPAGVFAPTQSGKTLMVLLHWVLGAPGACLATSTKYDLFMLTAGSRERERPGSVAVFDLTGAAPWPARVRWNPVDGCTELAVAGRRAAALMVSASKGDGDSSNHSFFVSRAKDVLRSMLLAAALGQVPLERFVAWCQDDEDGEAATILRKYPQFTPQARTLEQAQALVPETKSGVWETLRDGISCLTDATVVDSCLPRPGETPFDVRSWLASQGTIYVLGSEADAAQQASLVTAFVEHVLDEARRQALHQGATTGRERLSPPLVVVLDELPNICPLPSLPDTMSDSAGRGLIIAWAAQSRSQLETRWGPKGTASLLDNTTAMLVFGGLKSEDTLRWVSTIIGDRRDERVSTQARGGLFDVSGNHSRTVGLERDQILSPAGVRELPRGRALLIMRHLPPLVLRLIPVWKLPAWKQLQDDQTAIRNGGFQLSRTPEGGKQ